MRASTERLENNPMHIGNHCLNCATTTRSRRREFSEQAWTVLLAWGEVERRVVDQPICDDCYGELRDILIDRADDMASALANPQKLAATAAANAAAASKKKKTVAPAVAASKKKVATKAVAGKKKTRRVA